MGEWVWTKMASGSCRHPLGTETLHSLISHSWGGGHRSEKREDAGCSSGPQGLTH